MGQLTPTATASKTATTATTCYLLPPDAFATGYSYWLPLLLLLLLVQTGTSATQSYLKNDSRMVLQLLQVNRTCFVSEDKILSKISAIVSKNHPAEVVKNFTKLHLLYF